jgi:hypothetical protein
MEKITERQIPEFIKVPVYYYITDEEHEEGEGKIKFDFDEMTTEWDIQLSDLEKLEKFQVITENEMKALIRDKQIDEILND